MREFNEYYEWHVAKKAEYMAEALQKKHFIVEIAKTKEEAKKILLSMIPEGSSIGLGGSQTVIHLDVLDELRTDKYNLIDRYSSKYSQPPDYHFTAMRESLMADVFITSSNAVTQNGELVNMDCSGGRVAAMTYGPKKVIFVVGVNKLVKDIEAGIQRCYEIAPANAYKEGHYTLPCVETGVCNDCDAIQTETIAGRMCNYLSVILDAYKFPGRLNVIVVADEIGF
ncbi:MAG: lactate utilization protein [Herbinix sp.]|nr:lactate utilization protein [Herbinix sp.]